MDARTVTPPYTPPSLILDLNAVLFVIMQSGYGCVFFLLDVMPLNVLLNLLLKVSV